MDEKEFMQFKDWIPKIKEEGTDVWICLYKSIKDKEDNPKNDLLIYSSCLKKEYVENSLKKDDWDLCIGEPVGDIYSHENVIPLASKKEFPWNKKKLLGNK